MNKLLAVLLLLTSSAFAQSSGAWTAAAYAYGVNPSVAPGKVSTGNAAAGAATITLVSGTVILANGTEVMPYATTAPISIGVGTNAETVTPSAVSGCGKAQPVNSCQITATFSNVHGQGDVVSSATFGLQEAINSSVSAGGGLVIVDATWKSYGGATSNITSATGSAAVVIEDRRGNPVQAYAGTTPASKFAINGSGGPTLVGAILSTGLTASGSASNDFSGSTGTFKTSTGAVTFGGSSNTFTGTSPQLDLGVSGSVVGAVKFENATSGSITLSPVTGALGAVTVSLPATAGTVSLTRTTPCAAASASCTETTTTGMKIISGISGALNGASPSVAAVTFSTGFTSSATYACTATPNGASAAIAAGGIAITYTSATVVTFTSANALSNPVSFICIGS